MFRHGYSSSTVRYVCAALLLAIAALTTHFFFISAGNAPYFGGDEQLAGVAYNIVEYGRYGDLVLPESLPGIPRTHGFHTYGPYYFWLGAALSWIFGYSLEVMRSLHPLGLAFTVVLSIFVFRPRNIMFSVILAMALFTAFWRMEWSLIRPDIMIVVFASIFFLLITIVGRHPNAWRWWLTGFVVGAAVTSHQHGIILVVMSFVMLLAFNSPVHTDARRGHVSTEKFNWWRNGLFLCLGGAFSALIFITVIEFRIFDYLALITNYTDVFQDRSFATLFAKHFEFYWWDTSLLERIMIFVPLAISFGWSIVALFRRDAVSNMIRRWLLAPVFVAVGYHVYLGFWPNCCHMGYSIMAHFSVAWANVALLFVLFRIASVRWRSQAAFIRKGSSLAVVIAALIVLANFTADPPNWVKKARLYVGFQDYVNETLIGVPYKATTWGTFMFGINPDNGIELVENTVAAGLVSRFKRENHKDLAPEYLIFGRDELYGYAGSHLAGYRYFDLTTDLFPDTKYQLSRIVFAEPYRSTRVFKKIDEEADSNLQATIFNSADRTWYRWLNAPLDIEFESVEPMSVSVRYKYGEPYALFYDDLDTEIDHTKMADLPKGIYLIGIELKQTSERRSGLIIASPRQHITGIMYDLGTGDEVANYFPGEASSSIVVDHSGGPLYLAQVDNSPMADFEVTSVRAFTSLAVDERERKPVALPELLEWQAGSDNVKITKIGDGSVEVNGNASRYLYQLRSGPIAVAPDRQFELFVDLTSKTVPVAVGVLNEDHQWLVSPERRYNPLSFSSGNSETIEIVIANDKQSPSLETSEFKLRNVQLNSIDDILYADKLVACVDKKQNPPPGYCVNDRR